MQMKSTPREALCKVVSNYRTLGVDTHFHDVISQWWQCSLYLENLNQLARFWRTSTQMYPE